VPSGELARGILSRAIRASIAVGRAAPAAAWTFVASRRWLLGAVVATCGLLAVLSLGTQKKHHIEVVDEPAEPETKFDEVTNLGAAGSGGWFHRWVAEANNVERSVPGLTLDAPPADDSEPPDATHITRRLDAVRSRQSKGATLTGKIAEVNTTARQNSNAPLRPPARVLSRTADRSSNPFDGLPEPVIR
jgi:hypothetical protein